MARHIAPNQWAVEYTHKDSGERLLDVCRTEDGAVVYGDMIIATGHRDVELVEVRPRTGGPTTPLEGNMKDKLEYILESPERALTFTIIVLILVACAVAMTVTYGWAGLALGLAIPAVGSALSCLIDRRF